MTLCIPINVDVVSLCIVISKRIYDNSNKINYYHWLVRVSLFFLFVATCSFNVSATDKEIDVQKAISVVKMKESTITSLRWHSRVERVTDEKEKYLSGEAIVYYDQKNRFRIQKSETIPWVAGVSPFISCQMLITFDGKIQRMQESSKGVQSGDNDPLKAVEKVVPDGMISIGLNTKNNGVNWRGSPEGFGLFFPYVGTWDESVYPLRKFSDILQKTVKQKKYIKIFEDSDGVWSITYWALKIQDWEVYCRVIYDPAKGKSGAILNVFISELAALDNTDVPPTVSYKYDRVGDFFIPTEIRFLVSADKTGRPSIYDVYSIDDVEVNKEFSESDFVIDWQKGTNVYDDVTKQFYVVTGDPIDEADAVKAFKRMHGLIPEPTIPDNSQFGFLRMILLLLPILLVAYGLYRYFRRRG
ncbi:MAG: hypothetical protein LBU65_01840 [Planctomycetaceae bacterium]|jgi:hypothetical protein|nr:hypothetical protein [Planctomycetaceae bacterium]